MFAAVREWWRRVLQFREDAHAEARRLNVSPDRFQILKPPGEAEGFESCDELRFPPQDGDR